VLPSAQKPEIRTLGCLVGGGPARLCLSRGWVAASVDLPGQRRPFCVCCCSGLYRLSFRGRPAPLPQTGDMADLVAVARSPVGRGCYWRLGVCFSTPWGWTPPMCVHITSVCRPSDPGKGVLTSRGARQVRRRARLPGSWCSGEPEAGGAILTSSRRAVDVGVRVAGHVPVQPWLERARGSCSPPITGRVPRHPGAMAVVGRDHYRHSWVPRCRRSGRERTVVSPRIRRACRSVVASFTRRSDRCMGQRGEAWRRSATTCTLHPGR